MVSLGPHSTVPGARGPFDSPQPPPRRLDLTPPPNIRQERQAAQAVTRAGTRAGTQAGERGAQVATNLLRLFSAAAH